MMPKHFFHGALCVDHETAIPANPEKQNYSVCPRHWYVDALFKCKGCGDEFTWTAVEQKVWFDDYFFWIDSKPQHCKKCRTERRRLSELWKEYGTMVTAARNGGTSDQKRRIVLIVDELAQELGQLPEKMMQTKELFECQIKAKAEPPASADAR